MMMPWLELVRLVLVFAGFYLFVPFLVLKRRPRESWIVAMASATANFCLCVHVSFLLLGVFHLALSGTTVVFYVFWIAVSVLLKYPELRSGSQGWGMLAARLVRCGESLHTGSLRLPHFLVKEGASRSVNKFAPWCLLSASVLVIQAYFPLNNLRFLEIGNYSRSLSLAILTAGSDWKPDLSVPLFVPAQVWSGLPPTSVVSFSGVIFSALFVLVTGFACFQIINSRPASFFAASLAAMASLWSEYLRHHDTAAAGAAFMMLAAGLIRRRKLSAVLAGATGISMSVASSPMWISYVWFASGMIGILVAAFIIRFIRSLPYSLRPVTSICAAAVLMIAIFTSPLTLVADGPYQYESAARVCERIASSHPRNSWLIVSPAQELPFTYGRGWHLQLHEFVSKFTLSQLADPKFRFPYPVRDVFFIIERRPLRPPDAQGRPGSGRVDVLLDPHVRPYWLPLGRASLEFAASEMLAAYAGTHADAQVVHSDSHLVVYRTNGSLKP